MALSKMTVIMSAFVYLLMHNKYANKFSKMAYSTIACFISHILREANNNFLCMQKLAEKLPLTEIDKQSSADLFSFPTWLIVTLNPILSKCKTGTYFFGRQQISASKLQAKRHRPGDFFSPLVYIFGFLYRPNIREDRLLSKKWAHS